MFVDTIDCMKLKCTQQNLQFVNKTKKNLRIIQWYLIYISGGNLEVKVVVIFGNYIFGNYLCCSDSNKNGYAHWAKET